MGKLFQSIAFVVGCSLGFGAWALDSTPGYGFLDLSPCHRDSSYHPACRWISGQFKAWSQSQSDVVKRSLDLPSVLEPGQIQKLNSFYGLLRSVGLERIQFVYVDDGSGDQAETTMSGKTAIIALRPVFFASRARYGRVSEQQHALLHEMFHIYANLALGPDDSREPFWSGLAQALEWRDTRRTNPLIEPKAKLAAFNESKSLRDNGKYAQAVEADLRFARKVGFPSIYGTVKLSEYLPELGSFLIHDNTMAQAVPAVVREMLEGSALAFLFDGAPRMAQATAGLRMERTSDEYGFVGMLFDQSQFVCTVFLVRHGLAATAKHCLNPDWPASNNPNVRYSFLSLEFPSPAGRVRVDGMAITGILPDSGRNDFAFITYEARATEGRISVPELRLIRDLKMFAASTEGGLFTVGFALPEKPQHLVRLVSGRCGFDGQFRELDDVRFQGPLYGTNCPGWFGSSGSPVLSRSADSGELYLWGVLSHTFSSRAGAPIQTAIRQDAWGPYTDINFSPGYLAQDLAPSKMMPVSFAQYDVSVDEPSLNQRARIEVVANGLRRWLEMREGHPELLPNLEARLRVHVNIALSTGLNPATLLGHVQRLLENPPTEGQSLVEDEMYAGNLHLDPAQIASAMNWLKAIVSAAASASKLRREASLLPSALGPV